MERLCRITGQPFEITDEDLAFYAKMNVPPPTICPQERRRRRMVWRNERFLFRGVCELCKKNIITMYPPERTLPILCAECFWSDRWDPTQYGRDVDFSRPFFEQLAELFGVVPQLCMFKGNNVNSDYTLNSIHNKNCYMTSGADYNEDCLYGLNTQRSRDCIDHILIYDCQLCYGCLFSSRLYNCVGCQDSDTCSDSWFLFDCKGSHHCAFSSNLRNKEYVFLNEQLSKEEYERRLAETLQQSFKSPFWLYEGLEKVKQKAIHHSNFIVNGENVSGNYIRNCKNTRDAYDVEDCEDCRFCYYALSMKDCYDISCVGWGRLMYEVVSVGAGGAERVLFSNSALESHDIFYSRCIWNCSDLFGCTSLKNHQKYLILNKQYSKEEYEALVPKIIEHMKRTQEFGEFFSPSMSPFEYNRAMTIDHMPLTREEALRSGFRWHDGQEIGPSAEASGALTCAACQKQYRLVEQEIAFYTKQNIPAPRLCWPCRVQRLIRQRQPYQLFENTCSKCHASIRTPIAPGPSSGEVPVSGGPGQKEAVYCEKCYLESVY